MLAVLVPDHEPERAGSQVSLAFTLKLKFDIRGDRLLSFLAEGTQKYPTWRYFVFRSKLSDKKAVASRRKIVERLRYV